MSQAETAYSVNTIPSIFPPQKKTDKEKVKNDYEWYRQCVESGISIVNFDNDYYNNRNTRSIRRNKVVNYNLYNDIVDKSEVERVINPFKINNMDFPATYRNYPLLNPNINRLCGEERRRPFTPNVRVINEDVINQKLSITKERFSEFLLNTIISPKLDENKVKQELQNLQKWQTYEYRDIRERMAHQVLQYGYHTQYMKEEFSRGFEDLLIAGEEIYVIDIYGEEVRLRKANPLNIFTVRSGDSYRIEDSTLIVEDGYLPTGEVIDRYYEDLTEDDINEIERGHSNAQGMSKSNFNSGELRNIPFSIDSFVNQWGIGNLVMANREGITVFGGAYDTSGNVRVTRTLWRSMRKIGVVDYIDENDEYQRTIVPEDYKPNKEKGEIVKWYWINEWHEGSKIADRFYVRMRPRTVQMRHMDNLSISHPGIVGTVANVNTSRAKSIMDIGRDYQYLYNTLMYKTELQIAKYKGKVARLPLHLMPDGWDLDTIMYYAEIMGWMPVDAFNEGMKGSATGKLAGHMNESAPVIDMSDDKFIQTHLMLLEFIKKQTDELTGISPQRKGDVSNREAVGAVSAAINNSSYQTEKWYGLHDNTRARALACYLEAIKIAWRNKKAMKKQFVLDDATTAMLDFDGEIYAESEYAVHIGNTSSDLESINALKGMSQAFLQGGGGLGIVADLLTTGDPATLKRKIESYESQRQQQAQQSQEMEQQAKQQEIQQKIAFEQEKLQSEIQIKQYEIDQNNATKIQIAEIAAYNRQKNLDQNDNNIPDPIEIGNQALKKQDIDSKNIAAQLKLQFEERIKNRELLLKDKELALKDKEINVKKEVDLKKAETALKIAKENKNKYDSKRK